MPRHLPSGGRDLTRIPCKRVFGERGGVLELQRLEIFRVSSLESLQLTPKLGSDQRLRIELWHPFQEHEHVSVTASDIRLSQCEPSRYDAASINQ